MNWLIALTIVAIIIFIPIAIIAEQKELEEWNAFALEHECKVVAKKRATSSTGVAPIIGGNGGIAITTNTTPAQTGYECNDGITYWR